MIPTRARFRPNRSTKHSPAKTYQYAQRARLQRLCNRTSGELACEEILRSLGVFFMAEHIIFCGVRFLIADFYIPVDYGDLVLEVDGKSHRGKEGYDRDRDKYLKDQGINTLRFTNKDVLKKPAMVRQRILEALDGQHLARQSPEKEGR